MNTIPKEKISEYYGILNYPGKSAFVDVAHTLSERFTLAAGIALANDDLYPWAAPLAYSAENPSGSFSGQDPRLLLQAFANRMVCHNYADYLDRYHAAPPLPGALREARARIVTPEDWDRVASPLFTPAYIDGFKVYLAGRIRQERERFGMVNCCLNSVGDSLIAEILPLSPHVKMGGVVYTGPFTLGDDHGCNHNPAYGTGTHGAGADCSEEPGPGEPIKQRAKGIYRNALRGIKACDLFFAWIEDKECYGTLIEIGIAKALGKSIIIGSPESLDTGELWFAAQSAELMKTGPDVETVLADVLRSCPTYQD